MSKKEVLVRQSVNGGAARFRVYQLRELTAAHGLCFFSIEAVYQYEYMQKCTSDEMEIRILWDEESNMAVICLVNLIT